MTPSDFEAVCTEKGWRIDPTAGTVDGVAEGVAFRAFFPTHSLLLSVSLPEKALPHLQQKLLSPDFPLGAVEAATDGSRITVTPAAFPDTPAQLCDWILFCIRAAVSTVDNAYSDRHVSGTAEPAAAYFCGIAGAALGALVGIVPWLLTFIGITNLLLTDLGGWQPWFLGGFVGVASFYGYKLLHGAHRTGFALAAVLVTSLIAVLGYEMTTAVIVNWQLADELRENPEIYGEYYAEISDYYAPLTKENLTFFDVIAFTLTGDRLYSVLLDSLYGLAACGVGVFLMKRRIQDYTHSSAFLRSRRFR